MLNHNGRHRAFEDWNEAWSDVENVSQGSEGWERDLPSDGDIENNPGPMSNSHDDNRHCVEVPLLIVEEQEEEERLRRISQRRKQVEFGKSTLGYKVYTLLVPLHHREDGNDDHPITPDVFDLRSRRKWFGSLVAWRKTLHKWDRLERQWLKLCDNTVVNDICHSHLHSGRGDCLASCGDIEENPGPGKMGKGQNKFVSRRERAMSPGLEAERDQIYVPPCEGVRAPVDLDVDLAHPVDLGAPVEPVDVVGNALRVTGNRPGVVNFQFPRILPINMIMKSRIPTVRHIPGEIQGDVSDSLAAALGWYTSTRQDEHLFALLSFAKLVLRAPNSKHQHEQLVPAIKARLRKFVAGDILSLVNELETDLRQPNSGPPRRSKRKRTQADGVSETVLRKVRQAVGEGATRKGLNMLLSNGTHDPDDPAVLAKLKELHPHAEPVNLATFPEKLDPLLGDHEEGFWENLVKDAILHFPRGSAPGPSGLRPGHLQDALKKRGGGLALISAAGGCVNCGSREISRITMRCGCVQPT